MEKIVLDSGKVVYAADPYVPNESLLRAFLGRRREMTMVTAAWMGGVIMPPQAPLLVGDPGVGKNRLVYELARQSGLPLYILQGHEEITPEDLACSVRFSDETPGGMDYVLSPLATAMHKGGICFIDEVGKLRPRAMALLSSVLDDRRYVNSNLLADTIFAKPSFRLVSATNCGEVEALPEFVQSRMRPVIEVDYPPRAEINQLLEGLLAEEPDRDKLISVFWSLWMGADCPISYRIANHHIALALGLCDVEGLLRTKKASGVFQYALKKLNRKPGEFPLKAKHLEEAFEQLKQKEAA